MRVPLLLGLIFCGSLLASMASQPPSSTYLQKEIDRVMASHPGAFVVVEIASGKILAARNLQLAASRLESPGSTVKPFVLMALLESGKLDPKQQLVCRRPLKIGNVEMDCTHPVQIAELDASDAIAYSCNSYVSQVATRLNDSELVEVFRRAGFDSPSKLVAHEARGRIRLPSDSDSLRLEALGYRGIEVTPLELLQAYRRLAIRRGSSGIDADASVFQGLENSIAIGMARTAGVDGMKMAGKTGTAPTRNAKYSHGFFAGFAPAEKPEIAFMVFLEQGRGADAAAVAQPVLEAYARRRNTQ